MKNIYIDRYAFPDEIFYNEPVHDGLGIVVTIPCFNEQNLISSLESISECVLPKSFIEVIVIINQPENCNDDINKTNNETFKKAAEWAESNQTEHIRFLISPVINLPEKQAGVGMARKIAMDEAIRRFERISNPKGIIAGFDADATCDKNYFEQLENTFNNLPELNGASVFFQHPLNIANEKTLKGIISYELHLRYYVQAVRKAGYPYAFHTVGSSMAVRSGAYQKQGGMNKRKAGEDFYFLQKIMQLGNYGEIPSTTIIPSPRISTRVPFGTGKAMKTWSESGDNNFSTYNPKTFADLKLLIREIKDCYKKKGPELLNIYHKMPKSVKAFIAESEWLENMRICQADTKNSASFQKRVFNWLNGLKILQYVHYTRENSYPNVDIKEAVHWLFGKLQLPIPKPENLASMLSTLRSYERNNPSYFRGFKEKS